MKDKAKRRCNITHWSPLWGPLQSFLWIDSMLMLGYLPLGSIVLQHATFCRYFGIELQPFRQASLSQIIPIPL